ncbi:MAG: hypothetical protein FWD85_10605 [Microbacteriaceae bacterium]|nr:hypothetical protein [Microbacteriaceae bacterium]MCL2795746.1 hypothetical protein [Microbacteriaceae bacterium]
MASSDFDFLFGEWRVHHHKRVNPFDPADDHWVEFDTLTGARPTLSGLGNIDETTGELPGSGPFTGMSLRLYDPAADRWGIWWASTGAPGVLDAPVYGRFEHGVGEFVGAAEHRGIPFLQRFRWLDVETPSPVWEQQFSFDGGATWDGVNWRMEHTRT